MPAPTLVNSGTNAPTGSASSYSVTMPSSIVVGRLLRAVVACTGNVTISVNFGTSGMKWIKKAQYAQGSDLTMAVFEKIAESSNVLTVTSSSSGKWASVAQQFSGHGGTLGANKVTNGDFSGTVSDDWTTWSSSPVIESGRVKLTSIAGYHGYSQRPNILPNVPYLYHVDMEAKADNATAQSAMFRTANIGTATYVTPEWKVAANGVREYFSGVYTQPTVDVFTIDMQAYNSALGEAAGNQAWFDNVFIGEWRDPLSIGAQSSGSGALPDITFVAASSGTTSCSAPTGVQTNDLLIMGVIRNDGSSASPTTPSGWYPLLVKEVSGANFMYLWKYAESGTPAMGTWTSADMVMCGAWRNVNQTVPIGRFAQGNGSGTSITYSAISNFIGTATPAGSQVVCMAMHQNSGGNFSTAPTGTTSRLDAQQGASKGGIFDTNGAVTSWSSQSASVSGSADDWTSITIEILASKDTITLGSDLVVNGGFSSGSNWSVSGNWAISGGVAATTPSGGNQWLDQTGILTSGHTYLMTYDRSATAQDHLGNYATSDHDTARWIGWNGNIKMILCATETYLDFFASSTFEGNVDNVTCKRITRTPGV